MSDNPYKRAAQQAKAIALITIFEEWELTSADLASLTETDWLKAAREASINPPSPETQMLVCDIMSGQEALRAEYRRTA